jgi:hypothetical protein
VDDGPVAPAAVQSLSGPALDAACRLVAALERQAAVAGPAWWDANAPARRVTYVRRPAGELPPAPWPARRALDFCAELALALAALHEAGAAHGALRPASLAIRPDGGPLICAPAGAGTAADDLHGLGSVLLSLLTGRRDAAGAQIAGAPGPEANAAALLGALLSPEPADRPSSARQVAATLREIAAGVHDTTPGPPRARRRRARLVAALVLLVVACASGGYLAGYRVGPAGPALSKTTVTVPPAPPVSP